MWQHLFVGTSGYSCCPCRTLQRSSCSQLSQCPRRSSVRVKGNGHSLGAEETPNEDIEIFGLEHGWNVESIVHAAAPYEDFLDDQIFERSEPAGTHDGDDDASTFLDSLPLHARRHLEALEAEAREERHRLKPEQKKKESARLKTHKKLRVLGGDAAGKRILSPQGDQTRPMMEKVRGAVFDMMTSMTDGRLFDRSDRVSLNTNTEAVGNSEETTTTHTKTSRWLDLFAGTGAVGIEALSRGCQEAHFVELSPWVISNCLSPNLIECKCDNRAIVHSGRAEDFLKRSRRFGQKYAGGAFDFISVCPPYEAVSYSEILTLLTDSPFIHSETIVLVEYPAKCMHEIGDTLGPLTKVKDRRYGRTFVALYGPSIPHSTQG